MVADGAGIRTFYHHTNVMDDLSMAVAPSVRARFRAEIGRAPTPSWDDAVRIRRVRGWAYTEFIRKAGALTRNAGKTLALHLEAGIDCRPPAISACRSTSNEKPGSFFFLIQG